MVLAFGDFPHLSLRDISPRGEKPLSQLKLTALLKRRALPCVASLLKKPLLLRRGGTA